MSRIKRNRVVLLTILTIFSLMLALPGCKEGTEKSPVSSLFTDINASQHTVLPEAEQTYTLSGMVVKNNFPAYDKLEGIRVDLYYNNLLAMQKLSTSEGKYFFHEIPPAQYKLVAAANDATYQPASMIIEILPNGTISVATTTFMLINKTK